jgi:hypothetical protein
MKVRRSLQFSFKDFYRDNGYQGATRPQVTERFESKVLRLTILVLLSVLAFSLTPLAARGVSGRR